MSEYQYYEFLAIDRPLTGQQQAEVRALSTRAHMTPTSFTNEYHWGDFHGDPSRMVERYYDAHLYLANWGTHRVMLRPPKAVLDPKQAGRYCVGEQVSAWTSGGHLVLDFTSEAEEEYWEDDVERSLSAIVGIRAELAAGDLRPLYLAWLSAYGAWERDEDAFDYEEEEELEPPVTPGLGSLGAPQRSLAGFLRLDDDLLAAAAARRHAREQQEAARRADEQARREQVRRQVRELHLNRLAQDLEAAWNQVETSITTKKPREYDQAVELLRDLHALALRDEHAHTFTQRLTHLRERHQGKPSLIERLNDAGLTAE
ncbi:hypothetical protein ACIA8R_52285 [Nonomuraea sp. NPDC051191]|uniref:hypothetical protein n=1 Tax=Nonomuraea sp. NPDC051191 TaxID=3364372 RepID=UPI00379DCF75